MRIIQKKISLEPMASRLPSVWPAYLNNEEKIYYFDDVSLSGRSWQYISNWGMFPINIVLDHNPSKGLKYNEYTIVNGCHCYGSYIDNDGNPNHFDACGNDFYYDSLCDKEECVCSDQSTKCYDPTYFVLSFESLSKWYHFFTEYYNLLKKYSHCNRVYTSAEDYYNYESGTKYSSQMIYGTEKQTYLDIDVEFKEKGGIVEVMTFNKKTSVYTAMTPSEAHDEYSSDDLAMIDVYDVGFFKWICDNVVPSFPIPNRYREYWKKDVLFFPDVIKWLAWFAERTSYEGLYKTGENGEVDTWNCKSDGIDCCDCEEYFNRGGERVYSEMKKWYNDVQSKIILNKSKIDKSENCFIPTIIMPTEIQLTVDNLGNSSIFSKEYELGVDYRVAHYGDDENTLSGTVVSIDGKPMILSGGSGYVFDENYMEKSPDGWVDYTNKYINENKNDFYSTAFKYYAYDKDNVKYTSSIESIDFAKIDILSKMARKYPIESRDNGWVLINGSLYVINQLEYGTYDETNTYLGGRKYMVYREETTNTPYTIINGKRTYADFDSYKMIFTFPFFKEEFKRNEIGDNKIYYIDYDGCTYEVGENSSTLNIDGIDYYRIIGYSVDDISNKMYISKDGKILSGETLEEITDASIYDSNIVIPYPYDITIYKTDEITGKTISKLAPLKSYTKLTDDIGNDIEGMYVSPEGSINAQPRESTELEPLYQVGNVANISRFSKTIEKEEQIVNNANYFVGDIIKEMKFYFIEVTDSIADSTIVDVVLTEEGDIEINGEKTTNKYTSLLAIQKSVLARKELENKIDEVHVFYDDMLCDITYYVGATLKRKQGKRFNLSYDKDMSNHGVEYKETVRFVKESVEYYFKRYKSKTIPFRRNKVGNHSVSYPIFIYKLSQNIEHVDNSQYDASYEVPMAEFKTEMNIFSGNGDTYSQKYSGDMISRNDLQVFPTFMEEYRIGISSMENVNSNIYIDRGINAAFEKHLKLGEVHTLEDMVNYGNGYFKIMEN